MSDSKIRKRAEEVVYQWKLRLDSTRVPSQINLSCEDGLVDLIEAALEENY